MRKFVLARKPEWESSLLFDFWELGWRRLPDARKELWWEGFGERDLILFLGES